MLILISVLYNLLMVDDVAGVVADGPHKIRVSEFPWLDVFDDYGSVRSSNLLFYPKEDNSVLPPREVPSYWSSPSHEPEAYTALEGNHVGEQKFQNFGERLVPKLPFSSVPDSFHSKYTRQRGKLFEISTHNKAGSVTNKKQPYSVMLPLYIVPQGLYPREYRPKKIFGTSGDGQIQEYQYRMVLVMPPLRPLEGTADPSISPSLVGLQYR